MGFLDNPIRRRPTAGTSQPPGPAATGYQWTQYYDAAAVNDAGTGYGRWLWEQVPIPGYGDQPAQGRAPQYGPGGGASVVSVEPVGYGYVRVTYSDGSSEITEDRSPSAQQQQTYLSPDAPSGYIPIRDVQGNVIDYKQDFNYQGAPARREFDITAGLGEGLPLWQYNEGVR